MGKWKTIAKVAAYPVLHPVQTGQAAVSIGKTAAVTGVAGYVGWEMLTKDKSAARVVSEAVIGERATDTVAHTVSGVSDLVSGGNGKLGEASNALTSASRGINGIGSFINNLMTGNGGSMFGNFFGNLATGKVSGLGIAGLVGAALLIFGRTGWFGKIAGAMLAMLLIGNNSRQQEQKEEQPRRLPYCRASVYSPEGTPDKVFVKAWDAEQRELPAIEMTPGKYQQLRESKLTPMQMYYKLSGGVTEATTPDRETGLSR